MQTGSRLALVMAAAAVLLVSLTACASAGDDASAEPAAPAEAPAPEPAPEPAASAPAEPAPAPAEEPARSAGDDGGADFAAVAASLPLDGPKVIQSATIQLAIEEGDFETIVAQARSIATRAGGFVTDSSAVQAEDEQRLVSGTLTVRVPFERYSRVMSDLAELGEVEGRSETGEDVTQQFVDLESRARHLEALEGQLLGFLDETKTIGEALKVQSRLSEVQLQLEQIRGQLRFLENQSSFATIAIAIAERGPVPVVEEAVAEDEGWGIVDAWRTAASGFLTVIGAAFVGVATVAPILAVAVVAFAIWRIARRRVTQGNAGGSAPPAST